MNYTPPNCLKMMRKTKNQTRRITKPGERAIFKDGEIVQVLDARGRKKWAVGDHMAVAPGRGRHRCGRRVLIGIRQELVQDITEHDAKEEGADQVWSVRMVNGVVVQGPSYVAGFWQLWNSINKRKGQRMQDQPRVWVLIFGEIVELDEDRFEALVAEVEKSDLKAFARLPV